MSNEIIRDEYLEKLDRDLDAFLEREGAMYRTLVDRGMVTSQRLHEMTWRSVESITDYMGSVEIFGLLAAISRRVRRYGSYDDPFEYAFKLGFGERIADLSKDGDVIEEPSTIVGLMRIYARDALWSLVDQHLVACNVYDRLVEREKKNEEAAA